MTKNHKELSGPYQVGYKKPPVATRFKKGQSGNSKGRPKGTLNLTTLLAKSLAQKVTVTEGGRTKQITKAEAGTKNLANSYAKGDLRAIAQVHSIHGWMSVDEEPGAVSVESDEVLLRNVVSRLIPREAVKPKKPGRSRVPKAINPAKESS